MCASTNGGARVESAALYGYVFTITDQSFSARTLANQCVHNFVPLAGDPPADKRISAAGKDEDMVPGPADPVS